MSARRPALGRGLGALLGATPTVAGAPAAPGAPGEPEAESGGAHEIPIDRIDPNPEQPRRRFDAAQLESLTDSIQRHGVLQPVVVRRTGDRYELLVGERRWRAARLAGRRTIPAVVADVAPRDRLELALIENVQRHDLNPIELGLAFHALAEAGHTQEEIGRRVGLERSSVANLMRLLELPRELQEDVESGRLSTGHAKALLQVTNPERRRWLRDRVVAEELSVRAAELLAREAVGPPARPRARKAPAPSDPNLAHVVDALREALETRVRLVGVPARGRIEIEYFGPEDLERVVRRILEGR